VPSYRRAAEALSASLGDDFVALEIATGQCFGMSEVSAAVWRLLEQPITFEALCGRLQQDFAVDADRCAADVDELLGQMHRAGLVELVVD
jgi:hypothetical protein